MKWRLVSLCLALLIGQAFPSRISVYRCSDDSLVGTIWMRGWGPSIPVLLNPRLNQLYAFGYDGFYVIDCSTDAIVYTNNYVGVLSAALDSTDNKLYCPSYDELAARRRLSPPSRCRTASTSMPSGRRHTTRFMFPTVPTSPPSR